METTSSFTQIKVEHSYAFSTETSCEYMDIGDPEEDPLKISPEDIKIEIDDNIIVKEEKPDDYNSGVTEVVNFDTVPVTEPFDNVYYKQETVEDFVCKSEVEETTTCSKTFTDKSVVGNPFALTNCYTQLIPNNIVIPNFTQLENQTGPLKKDLEDLKIINNRLNKKADKLTAANVKIKLELKALKKENTALKKENYSVLSKSESEQLDVKQLEFKLRCCKARENILEKKVELLRAQVTKKVVGSKDEETLRKQASLLCDQIKDYKIEKRVLTRKIDGLNKKHLTLETEKNQMQAKYITLIKQLKGTLQQLHSLKNSLSNSIQIQTALEEKLERSKQHFNIINTNYGLKNEKLQKELTETKRHCEILKNSVLANEKILASMKEREKLFRDFKERMKQSEYQSTVWKQKYNEMGYDLVRKDTKCSVLKNKMILLGVELKKVEEQLKKKEEEEKTRTCEYCGF